MIRAARMFPPLVAFALLSLLSIPSHTRAAEPAVVAQPTAGPAYDATFDPVDAILKALQPRALFVGRTRGGLGYVILVDRAFYVRANRDGTVRVHAAYRSEPSQKS